MYAIICDARKGKNLGIETLALVDRGKSKKLWWTSDQTDLILGYRKKSAAEFALSRLHLNNPRIVSLDEAERIIQEQRDDILDKECVGSQEWDDHKIWR